MIPGMIWSNIDIDLVKPMCLFIVRDDEELKVVFNWKNSQPFLKKDLSQKGISLIFWTIGDNLSSLINLSKQIKKDNVNIFKNQINCSPPEKILQPIK